MSKLPHALSATVEEIGSETVRLTTEDEQKINWPKD